MGPSLALVAGLLLAVPPAGPLLAADRAFDAAVARRDRAAFLALVDPDAVFFGTDALLDGRDAVWSRWARFFEADGPTLRWQPTDGGVAPSGDLGWTVGEARFAWKAKGVAQDGIRYLTVWRRGPDGRPVVALDGSLEPVPPGASARTPVRTLASRDGKLEAAIGTFERGAGPGRTRGLYLVVRERRDGAWHVVRESEVPAPPAPR